MTGLATGMASGFAVLEAQSRPGGICASYQHDGFTFELGGGHWIFGGDAHVIRLIQRASELRHYQRRSAVLFLGKLPATRDLANVVVPFPLQDNLWALPTGLRQAALSEIVDSRPRSDSTPSTMDLWLRAQFGETLCRIFFDPFHDRYTAGLFRDIAPQDAHKSPIDRERVRFGAEHQNTDGGYNASFFYPVKGLDVVSRWLADQCTIRYGAAVTRIDRKKRRIELDDETTLPYDAVVATTPLDRLVEMAGLRDQVGTPDPHSSVLVLNMGVTLPDTPLARAGYHWIYIPDSASGLHRIGYYSNVDRRFLPADRRDDPATASLYVETAFPAGTELTSEERDRLIGNIIVELISSGLIVRADTVHPTWISTAYTWRAPGSDWVDRAIARCREFGVEPAGRYGRWCFQGIAASIREGLLLGSVLPRP